MLARGIGAGDGIRTRDIDLGKVALYQLSYSRPTENPIFAGNIPDVKRYGQITESKPFIILWTRWFAVLCYCSVPVGFWRQNFNRK